MLLSHGKDKMPRGCIFQQDNNPKHRANFIKNFFNSKKIRLLDWHSQNPDFYAIENLWKHLDRQLKGEKPTNKNDLFKMLTDCWAIFP